MGQKEGSANWFAVIAPVDQICINIWGIRVTYRKELFGNFYFGGEVSASFYSTEARNESGLKNHFHNRNKKK